MKLDFKVLLLVHYFIIAFGIPIPNLPTLYNSFGNYSDLTILTDNNSTAPYCYNNELHQSKIAIKDVSFLDELEAQYGLFCNQTENLHSILLQPSTFAVLIATIKKICALLQCKNESQTKLFWTPYVFILLPEEVSRNPILENEIIRAYSSVCLDNAKSFAINSEVYVLRFGLDSAEPIPAYEFYSIQNITILSKIAYPYSRFSTEAFLSKVLRRHDFLGTRLRAMGLERLSHFDAVSFKEVNGELLLGSGFNVMYFVAMAHALNASVIGVKGFQLTASDGNGSLTGIGKQLLEGDGDVSILHSEMLPVRAKYLAFLHPHYVARIMAYFKQPTPTSVRDIYIRSVKIELRIAVVCTLVLIMICILVISFVQKKWGEQSSQDASASNAFHWVISAFCQQGSHIQPSSISMKIGVLISLLFSVILYIGFSASIVSQLSVPVIPIKSFSDILASDMTIYRDNMTFAAKEYMDNALRLGKIKPMDMDPEERVLPSYLGVHKIAEYPAAFISIGDEFYLTTAARKEASESFVCKTVSEVSIDPIGRPTLSAMMVPKRSPYVEFLRYAQLQMREAGIHHRLHETYLRYSTPRCEKIGQRQHVELGFNDTITAFIFLLVFLIISSCALLVEICVTRFCLSGGKYEPS